MILRFGVRAATVFLVCSVVVGCHSDPVSTASTSSNGLHVLEQAFGKYMAATSFHAKSTVTVTADGKKAIWTERTYDFAGTQNASLRFGEIKSLDKGLMPAAFVVSNDHEMVEGSEGEAMRYPAPPNIPAISASYFLSKRWTHAAFLPNFFAGPEAVSMVTSTVPTIEKHETINGADCTILKFTGAGFWGTTTLAVDEKSGLILRITAKLEPLMPTLPPVLAGSKSLLYQEDFTDQKVDGAVDAALFKSEGLARKVTIGVTPAGWLKAGDPAPAFTVKRPNGSLVSLASLKGKVVFLDFWATWCGPCKETLPHTQALFMANRGKDLEILAIADDKIDLATKFVATNKYTFPIAVDDAHMIQRVFGVSAIPMFVVIDRQGKIAYVRNGADDGVEEADVIKKLLERK